MPGQATEPWRGLTPAIADVIEPAMDAAGAEIIESIGHEVTEYARPLEGEFGRNLQTGVREALRQFVELIRDPDSGRGTGRTVYVRLGEGEFRQGRTLDALQAAYRIGARVAWRKAAAAGRAAGIDAEDLAKLAESMFAYIDELSADSVEGYARAQSESEGERQRRRRELMTALMSDSPLDPADLRALAAAARWNLPRTIAPIVCAEADLPALARSLGHEALAGFREGYGTVVVPDPDGPGRREALVKAVEQAGDAATVGPSVGIAEPEDGLTPARSWGIAVAVRERGGGPTFVEDDPLQALVADSADILGRMAARALAPLDSLTPRAAERMLVTAGAYVATGGNAAAMADLLRVHPQTARYRLARLREAYGEQLDRPERKLELMLAVRYRLGRVA